MGAPKDSRDVSMDKGGREPEPDTTEELGKRPVSTACRRKVDRGVSSTHVSSPWSVLAHFFWGGAGAGGRVALPQRQPMAVTLDSYLSVRVWQSCSREGDRQGSLAFLRALDQRAPQG